MLLSSTWPNHPQPQPQSHLLSATTTTTTTQGILKKLDNIFCAPIVHFTNSSTTTTTTTTTQGILKKYDIPTAVFESFVDAEKAKVGEFLCDTHSLCFSCALFHAVWLLTWQTHMCRSFSSCPLVHVLFAWLLNRRTRARPSINEPSCAFLFASPFSCVAAGILNIGLVKTVYTVYIRYFWQGDHQIYGHIRCIYTI